MRRRGSDKVAARGSPTRPRHALAVLALLLAALAAYSNSFRTGVASDAALLVHDPRISAATPANVQALLTQQYWADISGGVYRPAASLTYLFNYAILGNGLDPAGYHWINFLLHAVNTLLVYLLGMALFRQLRPALMFAGLWSLHPVLTESVTNIAGRPDLLAAFGVLAGLVCHIRAAGASGRRKAAWLAALAAACAVGFFSKENAVTLLALMPLYDVIYRREAWRRAVPGYAAALLPLAVFLYARHLVLSPWPPPATAFTDNPLIGADFWTARLTAMQVIGLYLGLLAWPAKLSCDYSYNQIPLFGWSLDRPADRIALAALVLCVAAGALAALWFQRHKEVAFLIAFFFITLAPTSNLVIVIGSVMAERFLYLPSIAFAGLLVLALDRAARRFAPGRPTAAAAALLICVAFGVRTYARNFDWTDSLSLWTSAAAVTPENAKAHIALAEALMDSNPRDLPGAIREADRSLAILDGLPDERKVPGNYATAGRAYRLMGEAEPVEERRREWFEKALAILLEGRRVDAAVVEAIRRRPGGTRYATLGVADVYSELGRVYARLGEPEKAVQVLQHARVVRPGNQDASDSASLATVYYSAGNWKQAVVTLLEGSVMHPAHAPGFIRSALDLYRRMDPRGCAVGDNGLNLECPTVRADLCTALGNVARLHRARGQEGLRSEIVRSAREEFRCQGEGF